MKQTVAELVDVILRRLDERPETPPTEIGVRTWLTGQGYNKRDIEKALEVVRPHLSLPRQLERRIPGSVRHLSRFEMHKLNNEARDALARLDLYELMNPFEREMLMDRLMQSEGEVGMDELDYLVSWILCSTRDVESQQTVLDVFEGTHGELLN